MEFKIIPFKEVDRQTWDGWCLENEQTSYYHSWYWITYCLKFPRIKEDHTFALLHLETRKVIGLCPLAVSFNERKNYNELSYSGIPLGSPAVMHLRPSLRRKVMKVIFSRIGELVKVHNVKFIQMATHSLNRSACSGEELSHRYSFEFARYGMLPFVNNTSVIDLHEPEEKLLENISKYHRRNIHRASAAGITIKVFNKATNLDELKDLFYRYEDLHIQVAGRITRPQETWDVMFEAAQEGFATLFVAFKDGQAISYLYCGEFHRMAFGWSQANVEDYEEFSPRHLLEWEAIRYYKNAGFRFYELGEIYYHPQFLYVPTDKEKSISTFKERCGGFLLPKTFWHCYMDGQQMKAEVAGHMERFYEGWLPPDFLEGGEN
ncbi:MAG: GNAT family N-acetyltransferase [Candidatus Omnitrophica bacterium]|nr:GNAT family N-acetyltransferase [Candidatus Omnitrophota bacterium]